MPKNTQLAITPAYGCYACCYMHHIRKHPDQNKDEITLEHVDQHPKGSVPINFVRSPLLDRLTELWKVREGVV